jgi:Hsp20/alpha crystallin family
VVNFELPDVDKQDIHISFQRNKLVLTWETAEISEWEEEDGIVLREQVRKMYHRTLPLPDGTRVRAIFYIEPTSDFSDFLSLSLSVRRNPRSNDKQRTYFEIS